MATYSDGSEIKVGDHVVAPKSDTVVAGTVVNVLSTGEVIVGYVKAVGNGAAIIQFASVDARRLLGIEQVTMGETDIVGEIIEANNEEGG